ncbi:hypothetical protein ASC89_04405 [Devosia sp. Root413D1]|uniref:hypothetical protein n=1 Tax=Devosia sp. Root413D1 TaxID=1736531 RepID=UPI0006F2BDAC|nr:hypothetical protein [Devosia sp. Root413D1]KQW81079.1 hypothetical protein ASC89_04405 [Devosia sp. Root413D1]
MTTVKMPVGDMPGPGMPTVEFLEPDFARWTFLTDDPALQRAQFNYWRGWFGFEETDEPHSIEGRVWLVRRNGS